MSRIEDHASRDDDTKLLLVSNSSNASLVETKTGLELERVQTFEIGNVKSPHFFDIAPGLTKVEFEMRIGCF